MKGAVGKNLSCYCSFEFLMNLGVLVIHVVLVIAI